MPAFSGGLRFLLLLLCRSVATNDSIQHGQLRDISQGSSDGLRELDTSHSWTNITQRELFISDQQTNAPVESTTVVYKDNVTDGNSYAGNKDEASEDKKGIPRRSRAGWFRRAVDKMWWLRLLLIIIGLVCNSFSSVILCHRLLRCISVNVLTQGLTLANLCLLFTLLATTNWAGWKIDFSCRPLVFFLRVGITWSTLMMAAVSVDRFIAVTQPLRRQVLCRRKWAILVTAILLLISVLDATIQTIIVRDQDRGLGLGVIPGCQPVTRLLKLQEIYYVLHCVFIYVIPWLIVCTLNITIINSLRLQRNQWKKNSTTRCVGEFRVNVSLVVICITYALFCLPDVIFMLLHSRVHLQFAVPSVGGVGIKVDSQVALREFGNYCYIVQSIISPLALLSVGSMYRQVIGAIFCRPRNGQPGNTSIELSIRHPSSPTYQSPSDIEIKPTKHTFRYPSLEEP